MGSRAITFVIDDDASFLTAITRLLRAGGYTYKTFASAAEFLKEPPKDEPGCIIADLRMPGPSGLDLQEAMLKMEHHMPLIFLTGHGDIPTSVHAVKQGAEDFLTKPVKKDVLFAAIERALARGARELEERQRRQALRALFNTLTPREREVLAYVVKGQLNKQIAGELKTSERTIKAHRANIMEKLRVGSVAELVRLTQDAQFADQGSVIAS